MSIKITGQTLLICLICYVFNCFAAMDAEQFYQAGYYEEVVKGNLAEAIRYYEKCLKESERNRILQAKAHYRLAQCYEALGKHEAIKHYQMILDQFADQLELFQMAKTKLNKLVAEKEVHPLIKYYLERVSTSPGYHKSYDNRWLAFTDWTTGHLMLEDLTSHETIVLTASDSLGDDRFASGPVWSRDDKTFLYSYHWGPNSRAVRAVDLASKQTRLVYSKPNHVAFPLDISPKDGTILCRVIDFGHDPDEAGSLLFIDPTNGETDSIPHLDANARGLSYSPQGDAIVFDAALDKDVTKDILDRDIYILPLANFIPIRVTGEVFTQCNSPIWGPDGNTIIYQSSTQGNNELSTIAIDQTTRQPAGNPIRLTSDINAIINHELHLDDPLTHRELLPWENPSQNSHLNELVFDEEFNQPALNDAWRVFEWKGPNVYQYKTFGRFSLIENPGQLRYRLDPATLTHNFRHNFSPVFDAWCYWFYPSMEIMRPFAGHNWRLSSKVTYHMVDGANGRGLRIIVYFGPDIDAKTVLVIDRFKEFSIRPSFASGLIITLYDKGEKIAENDSATSPQDIIGVSQFTYFYQIVRQNADILVMLSDDGLNYHQVLSCPLPERALNYQQWVSLTGTSWFNPARSFADFDYIKLESIPSRK
jgi:hypothetical protein